MYTSKYFALLFGAAFVIALTSCGGANSTTGATVKTKETFEVRRGDVVIQLSRQDLISGLVSAELSESTPVKAGNEWIPLGSHEPARGALVEADRVRFNVEFARRIQGDSVAKINPLVPGERMDIRPFIVPGVVTIVDFYSEYCRACMVIKPYLTDLVEKRPDIFLRSVDVNRAGVSGIDFTSPLARQYGINSLPHFVIFNERGEHMASGHEAFILVRTWIEEAQD